MNLKISKEKRILEAAKFFFMGMVSEFIAEWSEDIASKKLQELLSENKDLADNIKNKVSNTLYESNSKQKDKMILVYEENNKPTLKYL